MIWGDAMDNNVKTREAFFGSISPAGGGYSVINGEKVHVDRLTETEAEGRTESGDWFAAKKEFGILKYGLTTALADADIAKEEITIPETQRVAEFLAGHQKDELYTVEHFSSWFRRLTGACLTGRNEFIRDNGLCHEDLCSPRFFLDLVAEKGVSNRPLLELQAVYADSESRYVKREEPTS